MIPSVFLLYYFFSSSAFENTVKPKYWTKSVFNLDKKNPSNNGYQNEDLIVWMRTAAFPNFKKLYRRVNHSEVAFKTGVPKVRSSTAG